MLVLSLRPTVLTISPETLYKYFSTQLINALFKENPKKGAIGRLSLFRESKRVLRSFHRILWQRGFLNKWGVFRMRAQQGVVGISESPP